MAKHKKKRRQPQPKKATRLTTSQHTNVPRFLIMLAVGVVGFFALYFWLAMQSGAVGGGDQAAQEPPAEETPAGTP